jgi:hypothetical protein
MEKILVSRRLQRPNPRQAGQFRRRDGWRQDEHQSV